MRKITIIIAILASALLFTAGKPVRKVACIGDSITFGFGMSMTDWARCNMPAVLQDKLGEGYEVRNFGFNSRTMMMSGDHPYMKEQMYQNAKDFCPDIVTIMLGTNDTKADNWTTQEEFENDLTTMVKELKSLKPKPKIYLCYPAWVAKPTWGINDSTIVNYMIPAIDKVAKKTRVKVIDTHKTLEGQSDKYIKDGVHPNIEGASMLAEEIYNAL